MYVSTLNSLFSVLGDLAYFELKFCVATPLCRVGVMKRIAERKAEEEEDIRKTNARNAKLEEVIVQCA